MIITDKIKEAFPILKSIDDNLLNTQNIKPQLYGIAKRNNEFSMVVYVLTANVPAIFQSLGKTIPPVLWTILDLTEAVLIDLNSIVNNTFKIYVYKNSDYDLKLEREYPLISNSIYESRKDNYIGLGIIGFNFQADELKEYKYYFYTADDITDGYRFSADRTFMEVVEEIGEREPSNEFLLGYHRVFEGFDRTNSLLGDDYALGVNYVRRINSDNQYVVIYSTTK